MEIKSRSTVNINNFFANKIDKCERYVGCLQWLCQLFDSNFDVDGLGNEDALISNFERGCLYSGMLSYSTESTFLNNIVSTIGKFSELNERLDALPEYINVSRFGKQDLLLGVTDLICKLRNIASRFPLAMGLLISYRNDIFLICLTKGKSYCETTLSSLLTITSTGDIMWYHDCSMGSITQIISDCIMSRKKNEESSVSVVDNEDMYFCCVLPTTLVLFTDDPARNAELYDTIYSSIDSAIQMIKQDEMTNNILYFGRKFKPKAAAPKSKPSQSSSTNKDNVQIAPVPHPQSNLKVIVTAKEVERSHAQRSPLPLPVLLGIDDNDNDNVDEYSDGESYSDIDKYIAEQARIAANSISITSNIYVQEELTVNDNHHVMNAEVNTLGNSISTNADRLHEIAPDVLRRSNTFRFQARGTIPIPSTGLGEQEILSRLGNVNGSSNNTNNNNSNAYNLMNPMELHQQCLDDEEVDNEEEGSDSNGLNDDRELGLLPIIINSTDSAVDMNSVLTEEGVAVGHVPLALSLSSAGRSVPMGCDIDIMDINVRHSLNMDEKIDDLLKKIHNFCDNDDDDDDEDDSDGDDNGEGDVIDGNDHACHDTGTYGLINAQVDDVSSPTETETQQPAPVLYLPNQYQYQYTYIGNTGNDTDTISNSLRLPHQENRTHAMITTSLANEVAATADMHEQEYVQPRHLDIEYHHRSSEDEDMLRESVVAEVMKSCEGEDMLSYGLRAYQAIKNSALTRTRHNVHAHAHGNLVLEVQSDGESRDDDDDDVSGDMMSATDDDDDDKDDDDDDEVEKTAGLEMENNIEMVSTHVNGDDDDAFVDMREYIDKIKSEIMTSSQPSINAPPVHHSGPGPGPVLALPVLSEGHGLDMYGSGSGSGSGVYNYRGEGDDDDLRQSVVSEVMRSYDNEDLLAYGLRAYQKIKASALAHNTDLYSSNSLESSISSSMLYSLTSTSEYTHKPNADDTDADDVLADDDDDDAEDDDDVLVDDKDGDDDDEVHEGVSLHEEVDGIVDNTNVLEVNTVHTPSPSLNVTADCNVLDNQDDMPHYSTQPRGDEGRATINNNTITSNNINVNHADISTDVSYDTSLVNTQTVNQNELTGDVTPLTDIPHAHAHAHSDDSEHSDGNDVAIDLATSQEIGPTTASTKASSIAVNDTKRCINDVAAVTTAIALDNTAKPSNATEETDMCSEFKHSPPTSNSHAHVYSIKEILATRKELIDNEYLAKLACRRLRQQAMGLKILEQYRLSTASTCDIHVQAVAVASRPVAAPLYSQQALESPAITSHEVQVQAQQVEVAEHRNAPQRPATESKAIVTVASINRDTNKTAEPKRSSSAGARVRTGPGFARPAANPLQSVAAPMVANGRQQQQQSSPGIVLTGPPSPSPSAARQVHHHQSPSPYLQLHSPGNYTVSSHQSSFSKHSTNSSNNNKYVVDLTRNGNGRGVGQLMSPDSVSSKSSGTTASASVNTNTSTNTGRGVSRGTGAGGRVGIKEAVTFDIPNDTDIKKRAQSAGRAGRGNNNSQTNQSAAPQYSKLSNHQQVKNALNNICLAGSHHSAARKDALDAIDLAMAGQVIHRDDEEGGAGGDGYSYDVKKQSVTILHFLILFYHNKSLSFRGVYGVIPQEVGQVIRIYGRGPKMLGEHQIEEYLKYETSSRSFKALPTKSLSGTVDAVSIDPSKLKKTAHFV